MAIKRGIVEMDRLSVFYRKAVRTGVPKPLLLRKERVRTASAPRDDYPTSSAGATRGDPMPWRATENRSGSGAGGARRS
jgi:hypothetical protein